jgi:hypothetical protein
MMNCHRFRKHDIGLPRRHDCDATMLEQVWQMVGVDVTLSHKSFLALCLVMSRYYHLCLKVKNKKKKKHCQHLCNYGYAFSILSEFGSIPFKNEINFRMLSCYILVY